MFKTNVWAIVVSALLSMIAYHETAFGAVWCEVHGRKEEEKSSWLQLVGAGLVSL